MFWPIQSKQTTYWLFWASVRKKYKALSQCTSVLHVNFSYQPQVFLCFLQMGGEEWRNSNRMQQGCGCSFDCASYSWFWKRRVLLNSDPRKQQSMGDMKNNIHKTKSISVWVMQFLVNSLFYTWTFIKNEFLCIYSAWRKHNLFIAKQIISAW